MYGSTVRRARESRGLTQMQLAEISGVKQSNISAIENDRRDPSASTLHKLLMSCGYEVVAQAGEKVIPLPASVDDLPGDVPESPYEEVDLETRVQMVTAVLQLASEIVRSR